MALETPTYISDFVAANPAAGDNRSEGDDHIRNIKAAILATFPAITGAVTGTHTELNLIDGSVAGTIVNSKAVVYGTAGQVNGTTLQQAGVNLFTVTASSTTVTLPTALIGVYIGLADGEDVPAPSLPTNPSTGNIVLLANNYGSNITVNRNGKTINGAASNYTLAANTVAVAVYYPNNWVIS